MRVAISRLMLRSIVPSNRKSNTNMLAGFLPENGVGDSVRTAGNVVDQKRLVVTALLLPFFNRSGVRADAELHAGHVVRRIQPRRTVRR